MSCGTVARLLGFLGAVLAASAAAAPPPETMRLPRETAPVGRIIIGLRAGTDLGAASASGRVRGAAVRAGLRLRADRELAPALRVVELEAPVAGAELAETLARLGSDPSVAFAEPDARVYRHAVAADALFPGQWYLQSAEASAIDAASAWDVTAGSGGTVVAVLDTGVRFDHPDLGRAGEGGRLLPGRDFVGPDPDGGLRVASDGDAWDADPSDPGDWVSAADLAQPLFADCVDDDSSWHGTRVAGMIGAVSNNGVGIAGATWAPWILPVRVLGKCFGYNSDILQGMRWAAGLPVAGVPANPYPAKVINMSLGAPGACTAGYVAVVQELAAAGVLVVASAGNSTGGPVEYPANCPGVAAVAGLRHVGTKVGFSSIGPEVALSAPGGNCVNTAPGQPCLFSLDTTVDTGTTVPAGPGYTDQFEVNVGTSFAAPSVAAIAALMHAVNGRLGAEALRERLREGTRAFPAPAGVAACRVPLDAFDTQLECACTTSTCGSGMAHAPSAIAAASRPIAAVALPATVAAGQEVVLDASGSAAACGRAVASYAWSVVSGVASPSGADGPVASIPAPASGSVVLRLTVTDDQGAQDSADVTVTAGSVTSNAEGPVSGDACPVPIVPVVATVPPDPAPAPAASGGGGGGGSLGLQWFALAPLIATRRRSR